MRLTLILVSTYLSFLLFNVQHQLPVLLHIPLAQQTTHHPHTLSTCADTVIVVLTSYIQGCKLTLARTPEAGKFHCGLVIRLEIHARPASREYSTSAGKLKV